MLTVLQRLGNVGFCLWCQKLKHLKLTFNCEDSRAKETDLIFSNQSRGGISLAVDSEQGVIHRTGTLIRRKELKCPQINHANDSDGEAGTVELRGDESKFRFQAEKS